MFAGTIREWLHSQFPYINRAPFPVIEPAARYPDKRLRHRQHHSRSLRRPRRQPTSQDPLGRHRHGTPRHRGVSLCATTLHHRYIFVCERRRERGLRS